MNCIVTFLPSKSNLLLRIGLFIRYQEAKTISYASIPLQLLLQDAYGQSIPYNYSKYEVIGERSRLNR